MRRNRPALFKGRHFEAEIIILCVRWYLRFSLSYRNLEEMMAERNLTVDHVTIWRWVQRYAPELNRRCRRELRMTNRSWRVDEPYCRVAGKWTYCSPGHPRPRVINVDGNPSYPRLIAVLKQTRELDRCWPLPVPFAISTTWLNRITGR